MSGRGKGSRAMGRLVGGPTPASPKKKQKAKREPSPLDILLPADTETDNSAMMELLLYMSSQMVAMEEFMAHRSKLTETKIRGMMQKGGAVPGLWLDVRGEAWRQPQGKKRSTFQRNGEDEAW